MNIGIIDNHPVMRTGMKLFLAKHFSEVNILTAETIDCYKILYKQDPELIILGICQLPNTDNLLQIRNTKRSFPRAKLILYDETTDSINASRYLKVGADGYVYKQTDLKDLLKCIRTVIIGQKYICEQIIREPQEITQMEFRRIPNEKISLSQKQLEIATYLIQGMRTSEIATALGKKVSTISTVKSTIFAKYQVDNILKLRDLLSIKARKQMI